MTRVTVNVDVDVHLDDVDTDDLVEELESRGVPVSSKKAEVPPLNGEETHPLHEIFYAFKFGLTDRATELSRAYVCDELGVVL